MSAKYSFAFAIMFFLYALVECSFIKPNNVPRVGRSNEAEGLFDQNAMGYVIKTIPSKNIPRMGRRNYDSVRLLLFFFKLNLFWCIRVIKVFNNYIQCLRWYLQIFQLSKKCTYKMCSIHKILIVIHLKWHFFKLIYIIFDFLHYRGNFVKRETPSSHHYHFY